MDNDRPPVPKDPSAWLVLIAGVSLVLPIVGVVAGGAGAALYATGDPTGLALIAGGIACLVLDVLIDFVWAAPALQPKADPTLNHPQAGLIGRCATIIEPIANGRGKVQVADTVWLAEGADAPAGSQVRIVGSRDVVLMVEPEPVTDADQTRNANVTMSGNGRTTKP